MIGEAIASGLALDESKMWDPDFKTAAQYVLFSKPLRAMLPGYVFRFLGGSVYYDRTPVQLPTRLSSFSVTSDLLSKRSAQL